MPDFVGEDSKNICSSESKKDRLHDVLSKWPCVRLWHKIPAIFQFMSLYFLMSMLALSGGIIFYYCEYDLMEEELSKYQFYAAQRDAMFTSEQKQILQEWDKISHNYSDNNMWEFRYSVFFTTTIFTTIGFGLQYPKTRAGHAFTIIYGMVSIPIYGYIAQLIGGIWIESIDTLFLHTLKISKKKWDKYHLPVYISMVLGLTCCLAYVIKSTARDEGFGRGLEEGDYFTALYFLWSATSTIGYGDVMMSGSNSLMTVLLGLWIASFNGMCLQLLTHIHGGVPTLEEAQINSQFNQKQPMEIDMNPISKKNINNFEEESEQIFSRIKIKSKAKQIVIKELKPEDDPTI